MTPYEQFLAEVEADARRHPPPWWARGSERLVGWMIDLVQVMLVCGVVHAAYLTGSINFTWLGWLVAPHLAQCVVHYRRGWRLKRVLELRVVGSNV